MITKDNINCLYLHLFSQMTHSDALMREFLFSWFCFSLRRTGTFPLSASQFEELVAVDVGGGSTVLDGQHLQKPQALKLKLYECSHQSQLQLFKFIVAVHMTNIKRGPDTTYPLLPVVTSKGYSGFLHDCAQFSF